MTATDQSTTVNINEGGQTAQQVNVTLKLNSESFKSFLHSWFQHFKQVAQRLLQDFQSLVLGAQLVSVVLGGLQLGVQLSFDLQTDALTLPVQQGRSLGFKVLQMCVQSLGVL